MLIIPRCNKNVVCLKDDGTLHMCEWATAHRAQRIWSSGRPGNLNHVPGLCAVETVITTAVIIACCPVAVPVVLDQRHTI